MPAYNQNEEITYIKNPYVDENHFINQKPKTVKLPKFEEVKEKLPKPVWKNHEKEIECYYKAWEIAFSNLHNPEEKNGFVSPYIDAAFNGNIFMWDSCFMLMFGKFASRIFNFQETLDNFYAKQHLDGFISREISEETGYENFTRHDPSSTGPNVMPWCEYEYYKMSKDKTRVEKILPVLLAYHQWLKNNRTWMDGTYWSTGWGCGMDNSPRMMDNISVDVRQFSHGHMVWVDACMQQLISCNVLIEMAKICGHEEDVSEIKVEKEHLRSVINNKLWDEETAYYYDLWNNGKLSMVKTIGSYWALLADVVPNERLKRFIGHLENEDEFCRPNRIPTLSADNPHYANDGDYWCGSVWAPTNYMVLKGLTKCGMHKLSFDIAKTTLFNVTEDFKKTGTLWENYAPESIGKGSIARSDFVGWSGLFPISILLEYVFGLELNSDKNEIIWHINLTDEFGVENLPFGTDGTVSLVCLDRKSAEERPYVCVSSDTDFKLILDLGGKTETFNIKPGTKNLTL